MQELGQTGETNYPLPTYAKGRSSPMLVDSLKTKAPSAIHRDSQAQSTARERTDHKVCKSQHFGTKRNCHVWTLGCCLGISSFPLWWQPLIQNSAETPSQRISMIPHNCFLFRANNPKSCFCPLLLALGNAVATWSAGQRNNAFAWGSQLPPNSTAVFVKLFIQPNWELDASTFNW